MSVLSEHLSVNDVCRVCCPDHCLSVSDELRGKIFVSDELSYALSLYFGVKVKGDSPKLSEESLVILKGFCDNVLELSKDLVNDDLKFLGGEHAFKCCHIGI